MGKYSAEYYKIYTSNPINKEKQRKRIRDFKFKSSARNRVKILEILGNKCIRCGFSDIRALQLDHIKGGGNKETIRFNNRHHMITFYLKNPEEIMKNLQLLCANCNWIKRVENKEVRRKYKD